VPDRIAAHQLALPALATKSPIQVDQLDVNEIILEVTLLTRSEMDRSHIALHSELADDLPAIHWDRVQLQQVILNIIIHASDRWAATGRETYELNLKGMDRRMCSCRSTIPAGAGSREHRSYLRSFLYDQGWWDGDGAINLPVDHRDA
jgi:C4-dicarboxylate-specific signal transduction histidine kinase